MQSVVKYWTLFLGLGVLLSAHSGEDNFIVGGYYPAWAKDLPVEKIQYWRYTHLFHAFLTFDKRGKLTLNPKAPAPVPCKKMCDLAHKYGTKMIISVGGGGHGGWEQATTPQAIKVFTKRILEVVKAGDYDGVDIDWEFPSTAKQGKQWDGLMVELRKQLDAMGNGTRKYWLTTALPGSAWGGRHVNTEVIKKYVDLVNVMAYDKCGHTWGKAGAHSALPDMKGFIGYWCKLGVPKSKLVFGVPWYSYVYHNFKRTDNAKDRKDGRKVEAWALWPRLQELRTKGNWKVRFDRNRQVVWYESANGRSYVAVDDEATMIRKTIWARSAGYRGVFTWHIACDVMPDGSQPLQTAMCDSARAKIVGAWKTGQGVAMNVSLPKVVAGLNHVYFDHKTGADRKIRRVILLRAGKTIVTDAHAGIAAPFPQEEIYRLKVPTNEGKGASTLQIDFDKSTGDSTGDVWWIAECPTPGEENR